jgi:hypothetical protein
MKTIILTAVMACAVLGSALGDLAASMQPKTWAELSTQGLVAATTGYATGCSSHLIGYADNAVWDPIGKKFLFLGAPHYCWPWKFIIYSESTNKWTNGSLPASGMDVGGSQIGHGYDHNAVDPTTGDVYHKPYHSRTVYRYSNGSWSTHSTVPSSVMPSLGITGGLAFFPEINGLVYIQGADGGVYYSNKNTGQWSRITQGLAMGPYSNLIEYDRVNQRVYFGGGNGSSDFYALDKDMKVTKKANVPITYGNSNGGASMSIDPVTGTVFIFSYEGSNRYQYNPATNQWGSFTGATPPLSFNFNEINAPVSTHGVIMYMTKSTVYLYKHAESGSTENENRMLVSGPEISVRPNPFNGNTNLNVEYRIMNTECRSIVLSIFDIKGRLIFSVKPELQHSTFDIHHSSFKTPGIYIARITFGNKIHTKRLILQK